MIALPNKCSCSHPTIIPKNWDTAKRSMDKNWCVFYRFYDASGKVKQMRVRGVNNYTDWEQRKDAVRDLLKDVTDSLKAGFNPVTNAKPRVKENKYEIDPDTSFIPALEMALARLKVEPKTRQEIGNILRHVSTAAIAISMNNIAVSTVRRKHIKAVLEQVETDKKEAAEEKPTNRRFTWSANTFNHYRKYLSVLFKELVEVEACEFNPVTAISKQKTITRIRETLSPEQRRLINDHLQTHYNRFWLFMQVFFHSGARTSELLKVKVQDVDLEQQFVKITIIKGKARREVKKVIKDVALQYWQKAIGEAKPTDYIFSIDLTPGPHLIRSEQISRRWRLHVKAPKATPDAKHKTKGGLGINVDFYSLKHLHSDQVAAELGLAAAGQHNSHTSTTTTKIYAVNEAEREAERLKKLGNKFA